APVFVELAGVIRSPDGRNGIAGGRVRRGYGPPKDSGMRLPRQARGLRAIGARGRLWQGRRMLCPTWRRSRARAIALAPSLLARAEALPAKTPPRPVPAPADAALRLDPVLASLRVATRVPGLAAAVIEGGRIVAIGAAGVPWVGAPRALTVDDPLHIGS